MLMVRRGFAKRRLKEYGKTAGSRRAVPLRTRVVTALEALPNRRIYDLRHTYATWSLAAGVDIFTLARRMGTSVKMIDRTYGHLVAGADAYERELLDAFDARSAAELGRAVVALEAEDAA
jgi:integrase